MLQGNIPEKQEKTPAFPSIAPVTVRPMSVEHRSEPREALVLPVNLAAGGQGVTRDISASGLYFETDSELQVDSAVDFAIELHTSAGPVKLVAQGKVMRIEHTGGRTGVAVKLLSSCLEPGTST